MKKFTSLTILALLSTFCFGQSGTPSPKATAAFNSAVGCSLTSTSGTWNCGDIFSGAAKPVTADNYVEVMGSTVKVSNSQSLFASASLVTGLYTNTLVTAKPSKTSGGNTSTGQGRGVFEGCASGCAERQSDYVWLSGGCRQHRRLRVFREWSRFWSCAGLSGANLNSIAK